MTIRLYDSAWVRLRDIDEPRQVLKDRSNPALFRVSGYNYDIDGRPFYVTEPAPEILGVLNMQAARELGLSTQYSAPRDIHI
jgi:hypothetical protein